MSTTQGAADLTMIVVAAGDSRRFGANKLFATLNGRPVLAWSLDACERSPLVRSMVLVVSDSSRPAVERLVARRGYRKLRAICLGGLRRQDSVRNGLLAVEGAELVGVHDAARPFLDDNVISRVVEATVRTGAAVAAVPVKDTVKVVGVTGVVEQTPPRSGLWAAQTPQIFRYASLVAAYRENDDRSVTDDAELVERAGRPVAVAHGSYDNIKITTPEDLLLARAIARRFVLSPVASGEGPSEGDPFRDTNGPGPGRGH